MTGPTTRSQTSTQLTGSRSDKVTATGKNPSNPPGRDTPKCESSQTKSKVPCESPTATANAKKDIINLNLRKPRDPFDPALQNKVDLVLHHIICQPVARTDLVEFALLVSSVTNVFSSQVKSLHGDVLAIVERLSRNATVGPEEGDNVTDNVNGRRRQVHRQGPVQSPDVTLDIGNSTNLGETNTGTSTTPWQSAQAGVAPGESNVTESNECGSNTGESNPSGIKIPEPDASEADSGIQDTPETDFDISSSGYISNNDIRISTDTNTTMEGAGANVEMEQDMPATVTTQIPPNPGTSTEVIPVEKNSQGGEANSGEMNSNQGQLQPVMDDQVPGPSTGRPSEVPNNVLNSWQDTMKDLTPPILNAIGCQNTTMQVTPTTQAASATACDNNGQTPPIEFLRADNAQTGTSFDANIPSTMSSSGLPTPLRDVTPMEDYQIEVMTSMPTPPSTTLGVDEQPHKLINPLQEGDQEEFHKLIEEMHSLLFDNGIMRPELPEVVKDKFRQAKMLLIQHGLVVDGRNMGRESSSTTATENESDLTIRQVAEPDPIFVAVAEFVTDAKELVRDNQPSKAAVLQMGGTVKRMVIDRYRKWFVWAINDKAIFLRIKSFHDKLKASLNMDYERDTFDLQMSERNVMDIILGKMQTVRISAGHFHSTISSSKHDWGRGDEDALTMRPDIIMDVNVTTAMSKSGGSTKSPMAGTGSLEVSGLENNVSIINAFSDMEKLNNSELSRHFFAVLNLLSHNKLSIKYDQFPSQESAKVISKILNKQMEISNPDIQKERYPTGAKIMMSRCPDLDQDEVLLTPVIPSKNLTLNDDDTQPGCSTSLGSAPTNRQTIQGALGEFVVDLGEPLDMNNLFGRSRKRKC